MKTFGLLNLCSTPVAKTCDAPLLFRAPSDANLSGLVTECFHFSNIITMFFPFFLIPLPTVISTSGPALQCMSVRVTDKAHKGMPAEKLPTFVMKTPGQMRGFGSWPWLKAQSMATTAPSCLRAHGLVWYWSHVGGKESAFMVCLSTPGCCNADRVGRLALTPFLMPCGPGEALPCFVSFPN